MSRNKASVSGGRGKAVLEAAVEALVRGRGGIETRVEVEVETVPEGRHLSEVMVERPYPIHELRSTGTRFLQVLHHYCFGRPL